MSMQQHAAKMFYKSTLKDQKIDPLSFQFFFQGLWFDVFSLESSLLNHCHFQSTTFGGLTFLVDFRSSYWSASIGLSNDATCPKME